MPSALLTLAIAAALLYAGLLGALVVAGRRAEASALARFIPDCVVLLKRLLGDPRVPQWSKLVLGLLVVYLISPIDLVPDFIPVAGQLDDVLIAALALRVSLRTAGPGLVGELWPGPAESLRLVLRAAWGASDRRR